MFVWAVLTFLDQMAEERRKTKDNLPLLDLLGFAAGKNPVYIFLGHFMKCFSQYRVVSRDWQENWPDFVLQ